MSNSVELRVPYADKEFTPLVIANNFKDNKINFNKSILLSDKISSNIKKKLIKRKKTGFGIPIKSWESIKSQKQYCNFVLDKYLQTL